MDSFTQLYGEVANQVESTSTQVFDKVESNVMYESNDCGWAIGVAGAEMAFESEDCSEDGTIVTFRAEDD